jgi:hypothetical protein
LIDPALLGDHAQGCVRGPVWPVFGQPVVTRFFGTPYQVSIWRLKTAIAGPLMSNTASHSAPSREVQHVDLSKPFSLVFGVYELANRGRKATMPVLGTNAGKRERMGTIQAGETWTQGDKMREVTVIAETGSPACGGAPTLKRASNSALVCRPCVGAKVRLGRLDGVRACGGCSSLGQMSGARNKE